MGCTACSNRRTGRIIPIERPKNTGTTNQNTNKAIQQGLTLRQRLRYTGR